MDQGDCGMRTTARLAFLLLSSVAALGPAFMAQARTVEPVGDERVLFDAANRERASRHLPLLRWDSALARAAHDHAVRMARANAISHQFPGEPGLSDRASRAGARFRLIEENVGVAVSATELHSAWMNSPPHRANLLNPQIDSAGISVVASMGQLFSVQDFARLTPALSLDEQERQVGRLLVVRGLRIVKTTGDMRKTCALDRGIVPGDHPKYIFRYQTADLHELPKELVSELRRGIYRSAAVGACPSMEEGGFSSFRLAVLLF